MVPQTVLPFLYEEEKSASGMTALAGLPTYLELAVVVGLQRSIEQHMKVRADGQGWTDSQMLTALVLLNVAGGSCVSDLGILEGDVGFAEVLRRVETHGLPRAQRQPLLKRWRRQSQRSMPSVSAAFRYLEAFHDAPEMERRVPHTAFIPTPNQHLRGLMRVNNDLLDFVQRRSRQTVATLDQDATLIESDKEEALYCYEKFKAYQPFTTYWAEEELVVHSEFRDGNVPAGHGQLRVLKEALQCLPADVETVRVRSDTAGYQWELLKFCAEGQDVRFGTIEFSVSVDVSPEFKRAVAAVPEQQWLPVYPESKTHPDKYRYEWAEVVYVPNELGRTKHGPEYRFIATRKPLQVQLTLDGQLNLPSRAVEFEKTGHYYVSGVVTNRTLPGGELVRWHRQRCGKSEETHGVIKEDLAGGQLPSGKFGVNAAWWGIAVLAFNLNSIMKRMVLKGEWAKKRLKAIRYAFIHLPGRIIHHARQLIIRLTSGHPSNSLLLEVRRTLLHLAFEPSG